MIIFKTFLVFYDLYFWFWFLTIRQIVAFGLAVIVTAEIDVETKRIVRENIKLDQTFKKYRALCFEKLAMEFCLCF